MPATITPTSRKLAAETAFLFFCHVSIRRAIAAAARSRKSGCTNAAATLKAANRTAVNVGTRESATLTIASRMPRHDPGQPEAGAVRFGKRQEDAFFRRPEVAQRVPCRAEAVQKRIPRKQDNEQQCRQQNGEQQLRFLEMPDDCGCNASQNTRAQQPEHCREAAYRVTNCGKREENQDAGKEVKSVRFSLLLSR